MATAGELPKLIYQPIGVIHSPFKEPRSTPIQPQAGRDIEATVEVFPSYVEGLQDLEGFSHVILLYHFHLSRPYSLKVKPFMDDHRRGLFATRAPARPNPIGLSIVRLDRVEGATLHIRDVDIVDGTPLLDIKPFVAAFDMHGERRIGWLEKQVHKLPGMQDDGRFAA